MPNPLIWLSGADPDVLRNAPTDRAKYLGIGGAVLTTATLAAVSMFFAMRMAAGAAVWAAVPLALVWFLVILNLDRWLVVSLQRTARKRQTLLLAAPRVVMALLFGVIISTPLTLLVFDSEVQVAVKEIQSAESRAFQQELEHGPDGRRIKELERREADLLAKRNGNGLVNPEDDPEIKQLRAALVPLERDYKLNDDKAACELTGDRCNGASGNRGDGPYYRKYVERRNAARADIDRTKGRIEEKAAALRRTAAENRSVLIEQAKNALPGVQNELRTLRDRQQDRRAAFEKKNGDNEGLLIRLKGLDKAAEGETQLLAAQLLFFLFITVLECLPIIVKVLQLFAPPGAYDEALERHRAKDRMLLDDRIRKLEGTGLRENSQHAEYKRRVEQIRAEKLGEMAERTVEAEARVHQAELSLWEREQMQQVAAEERRRLGAGGDAARNAWRDLPQNGAPPYAVPQQPAPEPLPAWIIRSNGPQGDARTTRDDLRLAPSQRKEPWYRRWFGGARR
ncbi:DUF4407 domain-containing protein [Spirillospora sp. NPDC050679]